MTLIYRKGIHLNNGKVKMNASNLNFMTKSDVISCIKMLKVKNCEGYDQIPQRVLIDEMDLLIDPLTKLFTMVYRDCTIPGQWLVAKITPIHLTWLNLSCESFKITCKRLFIQN